VFCTNFARITNAEEDDKYFLDFLNAAKKPLLYSAAGGCLGLGFLLGLRGLSKNAVTRSNMKMAMGALVGGTALCVSSGYLVTRTTMWTLGVNNTKEFGQKIDSMLPKAFPRNTQQEPTIVEEEDPLSVSFWMDNSLDKRDQRNN